MQPTRGLRSIIDLRREESIMDVNMMLNRKLKKLRIGTGNKNVIKLLGVWGDRDQDKLGKYLKPTQKKQ